MCGVVLSIIFPLSKCVCNDLSTLHQHTSQALLGSMNVNYIVSCAVRHCKYWCNHRLIFQILKTCLTIFGPYKQYTLPSQLCKWWVYLEKIQYEASIVTRQTQETTYLRNRGWTSSFNDCFHLDVVYWHTILRYNMPYVTTLIFYLFNLRSLLYFEMRNIHLMGPIHKCDSHSPFITSEEKWLQGKKRKHYWNKGKVTKPKMNILFYPMVYYANTFHPILTYSNDATKFSLDYEMEKNNQLPYACATVSGCTMSPSLSHGCLALICKIK